MPAPDYHVAIIGGGIVGSALALALGRAGLRVAVLEKQLEAGYHEGQPYALRVSAISLASEYFLRNIGAWSSIAESRVSSYQEMFVWDASGSGEIHFDCVDLQQTHLGHIVENDLIQLKLLDELASLPQVDVLNVSQLSGLQYGRNGVSVIASEAKPVTASLLVAADGANSWLRKQAGIELDAWPYRQHAVVAVVQPQSSHRATAWQVFLPTGPLAFLPLNDGTCSIVWSTSEERAAELIKLEEEEFCRELSKASEGRLGRMSLCSKRAVFPLKYQHAKAYTHDRVALVGDAAHVVHPLAGQGVNLGLLDAACLAEQVIAAVSVGRDPGSKKLLSRYQRKRRGENQAMALAFDFLNKLFGAQAASVVQLRNIGLSIAARWSHLKYFFMQQATGLNAVKSEWKPKKTGQPRSLLLPPDISDL